MLRTLLESEPKREKFVAGTFLSVSAHTALIAAALYATAQARTEPVRPAEMDRPIFFPMPKQSVPAFRPGATVQPPLNVRPLTFVPPRIDLAVPEIDISGFVTKPGDFSPNPIIAAGLTHGDRPTAGPADALFLPDQVERQASLAPGNAPPRYPELLRSSGVAGRVIAQFIVDEQGRAEEASVRFLHSDNQLFQSAVRAALGRMRFIPAQVGGRNVRQLVQMPFVFTLER
jgi:protein TonB